MMMEEENGIILLRGWGVFHKYEDEENYKLKEICNSEYEANQLIKKWQRQRHEFESWGDHGYLPPSRYMVELGQLQDSKTGKYYIWKRFYDRWNSDFTSRDRTNGFYKWKWSPWRLMRVFASKKDLEEYVALSIDWEENDKLKYPEYKCERVVLQKQWVK